jgi:hypothetical protein
MIVIKALTLFAASLNSQPFLKETGTVVSALQINPSTVPVWCVIVLVVSW